jgi:hypothetical protein
MKTFKLTETENKTLLSGLSIASTLLEDYDDKLSRQITVVLEIIQEQTNGK